MILPGRAMGIEVSHDEVITEVKKKVKLRCVIGGNVGRTSGSLKL